MRRRAAAALVALLAPILVGAEADEPLEVYAVNYPLAYFAERIGGEAVRVELPVPPEVDPAFWRPTVEAIGAFQRADLVVLNGAGYARWTDHAMLSRRRSVDTTAAVSERLIPLSSETTHSHGPEGEHAHRGYAFTTWLDLDLAAVQAEAVSRALARLLPAREVAFERALAALQDDLRFIDRRLRDGLEAVPERRIFASHPVYQYLAQRYGLDIVSMHFEPDAIPEEAQWKALEALLEAHPAKLMLWEAAPLPETVARLERLGVRPVVYAPGANAPPEGQFLDLMRANVDRLLEALE